MSRLSLYQRALGDRYGELPSAVQRFHGLTGSNLLQGWVETKAPASVLARGLALCLGAPHRNTRGPLRFVLDAGAQTETWTRHFPGRTMTSRMTLVAGRLEERLGAARLTFELVATESKLSMELVEMRFLGMPCPRWLMPQVVAEETGTGNQLQFLVRASLPWVGTVVSYRGHLNLSNRDSA